MAKYWITRFVLTVLPAPDSPLGMDKIHVKYTWNIIKSKKKDWKRKKKTLQNDKTPFFYTASWLNNEQKGFQIILT